MIEAKDEKQLGFDKEGIYTGLKADDESTHYDVMHVKYKQCSKCKKWFPASEYTLKANGAPNKCCPNCIEALKKAREARKAEKAEKEKKEEAQQPPLDGQHLASATIHYDLSQVPPQDLIQEMQRRGWKGNVQVIMNFEL